MMVAWTAPAHQPAEYTALTIVPFVESHTQYCSRYEYHLLTLSFRVTKTCLQLTSSCRPLCEDKRNEKAFHKIFECS